VCGRISDSDLDKIYIFASPKKNSEYITLSARNTSKDMNMIELLRAGLKDWKMLVREGIYLLLVEESSPKI